ncbi:hypothetical protein JTB14_029929 [Gonioctena quinquepunctata]|nr:hypothetical protein JTB14_029929 [Gonioctena quinquepunctata]
MVLQSGKRFGFEEDDGNFTIIENNGNPPDQDYYEEDDLHLAEQNMPYDESMIEYFGKHGCEQYIRGKFIRFGYKVLCLNSKSGYLSNFEIYQGNIPNSNQAHQKKFRKGDSSSSAAFRTDA